MNTYKFHKEHNNYEKMLHKDNTMTFRRHILHTFDNDHDTFDVNVFSPYVFDRESSQIMVKFYNYNLGNTLKMVDGTGIEPVNISALPMS
jgi:hypothetical protein